MAKRQEIVDAIRERLATIRTVNGYATDVGAHVFEWRGKAMAESDLPAVAFRDTELKLRELTGGMQDVSLSVELIVVVSAGAQTMGMTRAAIDDVIAAINFDPTWGGLAWDTAVDAIETAADHESRLVAFGRLVATVRYEQIRPIHA